MDNFISKAIGFTKNPLGIIALFVSLVYGFACMVLSNSIDHLIGPDERMPLIMFVISFPVIILSVFVYLVVFHSHKLYSPSDFQNEENFLAVRSFVRAKMEVNFRADDPPSEISKELEKLNYNSERLPHEIQDNLTLAGNIFKSFTDKMRQEEYKDQIELFTFAVHSFEYYLFTVEFKTGNLLHSALPIRENIIIKLHTNSNQTISLIAIGKNIIEGNVEIFTNRLIKHMSQFADRILRDYYK